MTEAEWLIEQRPENVWTFVRSETRFNRNILDSNQGKWDYYNERLLYLVGVAVCRRLAPLFPDPCCQRMLEVTESFAEGIATLDELADANDEIAALRDLGNSALPAASHAAVNAIFWLSPDDYKVIRILSHAGDAVGYLRAVDAGVLPAAATLQAGEAVWKHPAFLAGREAEERAECGIIRDVIGNPFRPSPPISPAILNWNDSTIPRLAEAIYDARTFDRLPELAAALEQAGCGNADILDHCRQPGPHVIGCWAVDAILGMT
jgi:hypothetical protein